MVLALVVPGCAHLISPRPFALSLTYGDIVLRRSATLARISSDGSVTATC